MSNTKRPRLQAELDGAPTYFTGKPCKNGHIARRRTISGACISCETKFNLQRKRSRYEITIYPERPQNVEVDR